MTTGNVSQFAVIVPEQPIPNGGVSGFALIVPLNEIPPQAAGAKFSQMAYISVGREYEIPKKPIPHLVRAIWGEPFYIED
jgi:hypothetical protein